MIGNDWDDLLKSEFEQPYFRELTKIIIAEYQQHTCYPPIGDVFHAFRLCAYQDTKVFILGQDPYHNPNQAMGLAFSVPRHTEIPPSLKNIFEELTDDLNLDMPTSGDLSAWARQGVLLLNAILTVRQHAPLSHKDFGWQRFTDHVLELLNAKETPVVFVLWGSYARSKRALISNPRHLLIENVHPSPLSAHRGFFGSKPFSHINAFLTKAHQKPIDFRLD